MLLVWLLFYMKGAGLVIGQQFLNSNLTVQVKEGTLKGVQKMSVVTGRKFYSFLGIPYAKPPVGYLRFRSPHKPSKWLGVREANRESKCIQWDPYEGSAGKIVGSEDCLYLSVHTPDLPSTSRFKKPVMVFIHGGAFVFGSPSSDSIYQPDLLMEHGIVYVAINYRLNVFGFLNMGTPNCTGNAGLKDMAMALKWIRKNISNFGGDPKNVTIFGQSSGAASVHLLMLSPRSKGLFGKAIAQSGNALTTGYITKNPKEKGFQLGRILGFHDEDPEKLVQFLKRKPAADLINAFREMASNIKKARPARALGDLFTPSVEAIKKNAFLPESPEKLITQAEPIPFLTGMDEEEGLIIFFVLDPASVSTLNFSQVIKDNFDFNTSQITYMIEEVTKFYSKSAEEKSKLEQLVHLLADIYFMKFYKIFDRYAKSNVPAYLYQFSYNGALNLVKKFIPLISPIKYDLPAGASHGDDTGYLLYPGHLGEKNISSADRRMIHNMCSLWTNFAKTGNPTHGMQNLKWTPYTVQKPSYLKISESLQMTDGKMFETRFTFWENLLTRVENKSYIPDGD